MDFISNQIGFVPLHCQTSKIEERWIVAMSVLIKGVDTENDEDDERLKSVKSKKRRLTMVI